MKGATLIGIPAKPIEDWHQKSSFSEVAFAFRITPEIIALGMGFALAMGILGGLLPFTRESARGTRGCRRPG